MNKTPKHLFLCLFLVACQVVAVSTAGGADFWASAGDPSIITNNDCGFVSAVAGAPRIRRSFMPAGETAPIYAADRLHSGDELQAPASGRVEMISGDNIAVVAADGAHLKLDGLRNFAVGAARVSRLDLDLAGGGARVQVRLNSQNPEAVLITAGDAEVLVRRGDVEVRADGGWRISVLSGEASARIRRGATSGAPFTVAEGTTIGGDGEEKLGESGYAAIRERLPFSFEVLNAALPPLPPMSYILEAP